MTGHDGLSACTLHGLRLNHSAHTVQVHGLHGFGLSAALLEHPAKKNAGPAGPAGRGQNGCGSGQSGIAVRRTSIGAKDKWAQWFSGLVSANAACSTRHPSELPLTDKPPACEVVAGSMSIRCLQSSSDVSSLSSHAASHLEWSTSQM